MVFRTMLGCFIPFINGGGGGRREGMTRSSILVTTAVGMLAINDPLSLRHDMNPSVWFSFLQVCIYIGLYLLLSFLWIGVLEVVNMWYNFYGHSWVLVLSLNVQFESYGKYTCFCFEWKALWSWDFELFFSDISNLKTKRSAWAALQV